MTRRLTGARPAYLRGDAGDSMQFGAGLDVDHQDAGFDRRLQLLVGLAHAGKNDLARVGAGLHAAHQLADRHDIEARAHRGEKLEHAEIRERLHRVADQMVGAGEGLVHHAVMAAQRARAVDVKWRAEARGEV